MMNSVQNIIHLYIVNLKSAILIGLFNLGLFCFTFIFINIEIMSCNIRTLARIISPDTITST